MRLIFAVAFLLLTAGCNQAMTDFASVARRTLPATPNTPEVAKGAGLLEGRKFSNGNITVKGTDMGMSVTVSPTQTAMKGTNFGMRVGLSRGSDGHRER
jgi:hypothetical protein